jgi:hypothetical protein
MENNNNTQISQAERNMQKYKLKIEDLNTKIKKIEKENEWKEFNNTYRIDERRKQYAQRELYGKTLLCRYHLSELAIAMDPQYQEWTNQQNASVNEMKIYEEEQMLFLLKDEFESKQNFLNRYKKSEGSQCCTI